MCGVVCVKFALWSLGDRKDDNSSSYHHQIGSINLSHCCHIFPLLYAWGCCTIIPCPFNIYPEIAGFCVFYYCAVLRCVQIIEYIMTRWSYPGFFCISHFLIIFSIELLKCLSGTFCLECAFKMKSILTIIFHAIHEAVCIQLTHFPYDDCENVCTFIVLPSSNRKYDPSAIV